MRSVKPSNVAARLAAFLLPTARKAVAADVRIGLGYTAVLLDDDRLGLAYTFRDKAAPCCSVFRDDRPLAGRLASELLELLDSADPISAAVGLACANALANRPGGRSLSGDVLAHLDIGPKDTAVMVGNFQPLVGPLKSRAGSLSVFDLSHREGVRPAHEAEAALAECQVAIITATALLNGTMDGLLRAASNCRQVAVLGASTPLLREAFAGTNVTLLSGVTAKSPKDILRVVSEGGGMRRFAPFVRKASLRMTDKEAGHGG